jgi:tRNA pseudouridine13 synthase
MTQTIGLEPTADLPLVTADLPGIGGRIRLQPEDFEVEEIPAYEPCGQGDHLYLWVEKRDMGADYFVRTVAHKLGVSPREVGTAGLKDRHAITRQMVSVPKTAAQQLHVLESDGIRILGTSWHTNKLRPGHLNGNRFNILVRQTNPDAGRLIEPLLARLKLVGLPNFYGPQRFGQGGETAQLGLALLSVDSRGADCPGDSAGVSEFRPKRKLNPFLKKLALSAAQSKLFNLYLSCRIRDGLLSQVLDGDIMVKRPFGGIFRVTEVQKEQQRFDNRETVHAGPIFGRKMFAASALAAAREAEVMNSAGLNEKSFDGFGKLLQGTRRPNLVYVDDLRAERETEGMRLRFSLPAGSYATVLLREVMKTVKLENVE